MSHTFFCLPTLELTTFEQQVCSTKIGYANALFLTTNSCKKRIVNNLDSAHQAKKSSETLTAVGLNDNRVVYIASSKFCEPKRFVRRLKKVEGKHNIQINSTITTRTGLFLKGWARAFPSTRLVPESKNGGDPRLLKCYMF